GGDQPALLELLEQSAEPDFVVAALDVVRQGFACGTCYVEIPDSGGAHRQLKREDTRLPGRVPRLEPGLEFDGTVSQLTAQVSVRDVIVATHASRASGLRGRPVPII